MKSTLYVCKYEYMDKIWSSKYIERDQINNESKLEILFCCSNWNLFLYVNCAIGWIFFVLFFVYIIYLDGCFVFALLFLYVVVLYSLFGVKKAKLQLIDLISTWYCYEFYVLIFNNFMYSDCNLCV
jgi:hypothetical protein